MDEDGLEGRRRRRRELRRGVGRSRLTLKEVGGEIGGDLPGRFGRRVNHHQGGGRK
jgi:hypothetical protein